jgi:uncharacterized protein YwgA
MDRLQRAAILTELMDRLRAAGSWCGETHMQKAVYFLQEAFEVPLGYEYIFYKYGPYSFDLTEDLTALRADYLIEWNHRSPGYGPSLIPTSWSDQLRQRYPKTLEKYRPAIQSVSQALGRKDVKELEKLATALYVTRQAGAPSDVDSRARRLCELKLHVSLEESQAAVEEVDQICQRATVTH